MSYDDDNIFLENVAGNLDPKKVEQAFAYDEYKKSVNNDSYEDDQIYNEIFDKLGTSIEDFAMRIANKIADNPKLMKKITKAVLDNIEIKE